MPDFRAIILDTRSIDNASRYVALDLRCPECLGAGYVRSWAYSEWLAARNNYSVGRIAAEIVAYDEAHPMPDDTQTCGECEGAGSIPTAQGRAILALFDRYRRKTFAK